MSNRCSGEIAGQTGASGFHGPAFPWNRNRLAGQVRLSGLGLLAMLVLAGCATTGPPAQRDASYATVSEAVDRNDCAAAETATQALAQNHSADARLPDAYLETAYVCLRAGNPDTAEDLAVTFLDDFSGHPSQDYGHYLNALAAYVRWRTLPPDTATQTAATGARTAFERFRVLMEHHPDTAYASDIRPLLVDLREGLARLELTYIRQDLSDGRHDEVIPRARYVLTHYGRTESGPYALAALVEAHEARGENEEARRWLRQLESDWPDHPVLETLEST